MKGIEVYGILLCSGGGQVPFGVNGDVWMIALVGKERRYPSGSVWSVVVCDKLRKGQEFGRIILLVVTVDPEVLF